MIQCVKCMVNYIFKEKGWMQQLFQEVASQFQSPNQYDKFIKESQKEYDIKIYRLHTFGIDHALNIFSQLQNKYKENQIQPLPCGWHQNERRLYVWFIVCYINMKLLDPIKFVDNQKYWKHISHTFWDKDIPFLKYQLLTIIKTKGRANWKTKEDQLLQQVYPKHEKGEWNEVAKQFYFRSRGQFFKTPKQCRERWQNHLNKEINKGEWTIQQDKIIFQFIREYGTKWAKIIPLLNNSRTEHMIKNRSKAVTNKVMQERGVTWQQAIQLICSDKRDGEKKECPKDKNPHQMKEDDNTKKFSNQQIEFVQSQQVFDEVLEQKDLKEKKTKRRGRPPKTKINEQGKSFRKVENDNQNMLKNSIRMSGQLKKSIEIEGCKIQGFSLSKYAPQFIYQSQQLSQSMLSYSNDFFQRISYSGNFSGHHNSFPHIAIQEQSYIGLQRFSLKEQKSDRFQIKIPQNLSMMSEGLGKIKPNESSISHFLK